MIADLSLAYKLIPGALLETCYMVIASTFFSGLLGLPLGLLLFQTAKKKTAKSFLLYKTLSFLVNAGRSIPFAILMIALIPLTKWLVGTSLGTTAAIIPLSLAAAPFFARLVENNLQEIDPALEEATLLMGGSSMQILIKVLIPESLPAQIKALTLTAVNLIGYSAMAGLIGGGGLGQIALQYGYQRFNTFLLSISVIFLFLLVELTQKISNQVVKTILKNRGQKNA